MSATRWTIGVGTHGETSAIYEPPASRDERGIFVCAHGAGGSMSDRSTVAAANAMRTIGLGVVRFNFLYKEKGSGRPDPMPLLKRCIEAVVAHVQAETLPRRVIIGGRSMGGRAASMLAAEGFAASGLLLLAYPLHPAGKPEQLRDAHLPAISIPTLCLNGTRDALCIPALMENVLQAVGPRFRMHWLEGADHSWHVLKSSGRTDADILAEAAGATDAWLTDELDV